MTNNRKVTGKHLLNFLSKLSKEELKKPVVFISDEFGLSIPISKVKKAAYDLLWDGEDDPSRLHTKNYFLKEGHDAADVEMYIVEIEKGDLLIE